MEHSAMKKILKIDVGGQGWHSGLHPKVPQTIKRKVEEIFDVMVAIVEEGVRSGEFRDMNPKEACYLLGALLRGFHFKGPLQEKELSLNKSTDMIHDFVLHGIVKART